MTMPVFSVIITTYRRLSLLEVAVDSVISQSFRDFECLIINDEPEDDHKIRVLVDDFKDGRLKVMTNSVNKGGNFCRNLGIQHAQGRFIAFLDDDDIWLPEKLMRHYEYHNKTPNSLVYSSIFKLYLGSSDKAVMENAPIISQNAFLAMVSGIFSISTTSSVTVDASIVPLPLFDESLLSFQDWDAWASLASLDRKVQFVRIPEALVYFVQHSETDRVSKNINTRRAGLEQIYQKYGGALIRKFYIKEKFNIAVLESQMFSKNPVLSRLYLSFIFFRTSAFWLNNYSIKRFFGFLLFGR